MNSCNSLMIIIESHGIDKIDSTRTAVPWDFKSQLQMKYTPSEMHIAMNWRCFHFPVTQTSPKACKPFKPIVSWNVGGSISLFPQALGSGLQSIHPRKDTMLVAKSK